MEQTIFGKTGLRVSVIGLGGGGYSRLGMSQGKSIDDAARLVRAALDLGVTLFDTAEGYGTEPAMGAGLAGRRDEAVLCTKAGCRTGEGWRTPQQLRETVERSLRQLRTDRIDVYQLHGVRPEHYAHARDVLLPELRDLQAAGKIRFAGLTEAFEADTAHVTLAQAMKDPWDTFMVGYNLLNQSADQFPALRAAERPGALAMFVVRHALQSLENFSSALNRLEASGELDQPADQIVTRIREILQQRPTPLLPDLAYRFARHSPSMDVVLCGTGSLDHLRANIQAVNSPPLDDATLNFLRTTFAKVTSESGKTPDRGA